MSPLSIEMITASAPLARGRAAGSDSAADRRAVDSFDEQLRMALKPSAPPERPHADDKAARKADARKDAKKSDAARPEEKPDRDESAGDVAGDCEQTAPAPRAEDNQAGQNDGGESQGDESGCCDDAAALAAAQAGETPAEETAMQSELLPADPQAAGEFSQIGQKQGETAADAINGESRAATNGGEADAQAAEVAASDASLGADGEESATATSGEANELNRRESARQAALGNVEDEAAKVAETAGDAAVQSSAAVSEAESNRSAKEADERRKSAESSEESEEPGGQKAAAAQAGGATASPHDVEVPAVEDAKEPAAATLKKDTSGDAKTAAVEANPAETALGQRLAAARESQAAAAAQTDGGDTSDAVDRARFVQRVAKAFEGLGRDGGTMRIRLHPAELGSLRLEVAVRNGALTARLETETKEAKNVLLDNLPALRERLAGQDIKIERFDVDYSGGNSGGSSPGAGDYQQTDRGAEGRQPQSQARRNQDGGGDNVSAATLPRRLGAASRLDFVA